MAWAEKASKGISGIHTQLLHENNLSQFESLAFPLSRKIPDSDGKLQEHGVQL